MTENYSFADGVVSFMIALTGVAEAAHLYGVFLHRPLSECAILFGILSALALIALVTVAIWRRRRRRQPGIKGEDGLATRILLVCVILLAVSQLLYIVMGKGVYRQGDMTVETVGSFLQTNALYQVNPMTGRAYEGGIPSRLKVLCLPTMYASFCSFFHMPPDRLVWCVIPVLTLAACYAAYTCLAGSLFPGDKRRQLCFLFIVALLIWAGNYEAGVDGFQILSSGWRGVTLRNTVLIPYAISLCLRKKYLHALLCILAEVCIVWTLYGLGACLLVIVGMMIIQFLWGKRKPGEEDAR